MPEVEIGTEEDRYPPTVWSRYRETGLPIVALAGMLAVVVGLALDLEWLTQYGLLAVVVAAVLVVPALFLEYRADMAYDSAHPPAESEVQA